MNSLELRVYFLLQFNFYLLPSLHREEKSSLRHVAMVATLLDDSKLQLSLKSEFTLFQTCPALFNLSSLMF